VHAIFIKQAKKLAKAISAHMGKASTPFDELMDSIDWEGWEEFMDLFGKQLVLMGKLGTKEAYAQIDFNDPKVLELANIAAIKYAEERSAELVGKRVLDDGSIVDNPNSDYTINEATREMIRADVVQAMEEGMSNDDLEKVLQDHFAFSAQRAETIARTETAVADTNGNKVLYRESGQVQEKQWIVGADCCDECAELNDEVVDLEDMFSDGSDVPPAHPNCRCDFLPLLVQAEEAEGEE
jgi:SPP1 gp7 family putative phage head morphogenesis protein